MQTANNHIYFVNTVNRDGMTFRMLQRTSVSLFIKDIANGCGVMGTLLQ